MTHRLDQPLRAFETFDLHLASYLLCSGLQLRDMKREDGRVVFAFDESAGLRKALVDYANDGVVGVRSFSNTLRDLKGLTRGVQGE